MNKELLAGVGALVALVGGVARADIRPLGRVDLSTEAKKEGSRLSTLSAQALMRSDYMTAIAFADKAIAVDAPSPWPYYDKAEALVAQKQVDEALPLFAAAIARFDASDLWGRSVAMYGRADALMAAGRCREGSAAFDQYISFVKPYDAAAVAMATTRRSTCVAPRTSIVRSTTPGDLSTPERQPVKGTESPEREPPMPELPQHHQ